ncbi:hypothetical protein ACFZCV_29160 [Streptomyces sp. NPDC007920]|uniref:hypothetical protein n=1 Tax=Streptomyces sp. NPDC007920 TaxID=3364794 RepID=UPI0036ED1042
MSRGRHRHSPPLHRLLPSSAIAGVSVVCALGPWAFTDAAVLRLLAGTAAVTAVLGAVVMRRWDAQAGRRVADLTRARVSDEWRFEERIAELETDLEESRELRGRLEQKLRARRTELAGLRNEHAALLRRYATAETGRASALEGRRLLEIETGPEVPALSAAPTDAGDAADAVEAVEAADVVDTVETADVEGAETHESAAPATGPAEKSPGATEPGAFSPEGSELYLRAEAALSRLGKDAARAARTDEAAGTGTSEEADTASETDPVREASVPAEGDAAPESAADEADETHERATATDEAGTETGPADREDAAEATGATEVVEPAEQAEPADRSHSTGATGATGAAEAAEPVDRPVAATATADAGEQAAPTSSAPSAPAPSVPAPAGPAPSVPAPSTKAVEPAKPAPRLPTGHFTVPTAVAVVPAAPARRPLVEGGFDFFGTKADASATESDTVRNDGLGDAVGQESLAPHKGEAESQYKPADADAPAAGHQVIDLTAHDETEQINLPGLRTAAS